jgi:hypothetical protein
MRKVVLASMAVLAFLTSAQVSGAVSDKEKWIRVENARDLYPIWAVYITPAGQSGWGEDQLGATTIAAGDSHTWTIPWSGCRIDIKAVTFTGLSTARYDVNVCGGGVWTVFDE